jgi:hypothetical protein
MIYSYYSIHSILNDMLADTSEMIINECSIWLPCVILYNRVSIKVIMNDQQNC